MADDNLVSGICDEICRCKDLLKVYSNIPSGAFGSMMIEQAMNKAKESLRTGDITEMLKSYKELKACE